MSETKEYEYVRATVIDGTCTLRYQVKGLQVPGSHQHDEDVSDWTDDDIRRLAHDMVDAPLEQVEVIWD